MAVSANGFIVVTVMTVANVFFFFFFFVDQDKSLTDYKLNKNLSVRILSDTKFCIIFRGKDCTAFYWQH